MLILILKAEMFLKKPREEKEYDSDTAVNCYLWAHTLRLLFFDAAANFIHKRIKKGHDI